MKTTKLPVSLALSALFVTALSTGQALAKGLQAEGRPGMPKQDLSLDYGADGSQGHEPGPEHAQPNIYLR